MCFSIICTGDKHQFLFVQLENENPVILLDVKKGLPYTHLLREMIYEINPGKAN